MTSPNDSTATRVASLGVLRSGLTLKKWPGVFDVMPKEAIVWLSPTNEKLKAGVVTQIRWIEGPRPIEATLTVPLEILEGLPLLTDLLEPPHDLSSIDKHKVVFVEGPVVVGEPVACEVSLFDEGFGLADEWLEGQHPTEKTKCFFKKSLHAISVEDAPMFIEVYRLVDSGAFDADDEHRIAAMCVAVAYFTLGPSS